MWVCYNVIVTSSGVGGITCPDTTVTGALNTPSYFEIGDGSGSLVTGDTETPTKVSFTGIEGRVLLFSEGRYAINGDRGLSGTCTFTMEIT